MPTPIGNMEDITLRAIETLKNSDIILAEDTRHAKKLLKHYNVLTKVNSYHLNNEHKRVDEYIQMLVNGSTVSLITDAGTPCISDPGFLLNEGATGVKLAMTGRVPCKIQGIVEAGDLLVSAGNGPETFCFCFFRIFTVGLIIFSSSL